MILKSPGPNNVRISIDAGLGLPHLLAYPGRISRGFEMPRRNGLKSTLAGLAAAAAILTGIHGALAATAKATFAGGCFWCVESDFDRVPGVLKTVSGYTGGTLKDPTYEAVTSGGTGHYEAVEITYDPAKVTFEKLLEVFWHSVDPTDAGGQFTY